MSASSVFDDFKGIGEDKIFALGRTAQDFNELWGKLEGLPMCDF